jgi:phenylpropionate dioxygenase-like ring-hydroxylating dioxygenase large terminal subunit
MTNAPAPLGTARIPLPPFPNGWYKVCFSDELPRGGVRPVRQCGADLVLYRGEDGVAHLLEAHCPHLGAHLGFGGKVTGSCLRCPFHAWEFAGDGQCTRVPYASRIPPRAQLATWPLVEKNGYLAMWHHAEKKAPEYAIPEIPEVTDPSYVLYKTKSWSVDTHLQEVFENAIDVPHFVVLHGFDVKKTNWVPDGPFFSLELDVKRDAKAQTDEEGQTFIRSFVYGPGLSLTRVSGLMKGVSVQTLTPLAPEKIEIAHRYYVHKESPKDKMEAFFDCYGKDWIDDFEIWNRKIFRARPVLAEGDGDLGVFRRWYRQFYSVPVNVEV